MKAISFIIIWTAGFFSLFIFFSLTFIGPDYFHELVALVKQIEGSEPHLTPMKKEMLVRAQSIEHHPLSQKPYFYGIANFAVYPLIGTISALLFATVLKKRQYTRQT